MTATPSLTLQGVWQKRIPILIPFEKVIERANSTNLTRVFDQALLTTNGMTSESLSFKLICFKFDDMKAF
jgi:hypothetical protein